MTESASYRDGRARAGEPGTVGGLLTTALTMEDQISNGVYEEYLDRAKWPAGLDDATFLLIKERLTTLINDTRQHNKILQALMEQHAKSK